MFNARAERILLGLAAQAAVAIPLRRWKVAPMHRRAKGKRFRPKLFRSRSTLRVPWRRAPPTSENGRYCYQLIHETIASVSLLPETI
jgi:hypothetical protein